MPETSICVSAGYEDDSKRILSPSAIPSAVTTRDPPGLTVGDDSFISFRRITYATYNFSGSTVVRPFLVTETS